MADTLDSLVSQNSGSQPSRAAASGQTQESTNDLLNQLVSMQSKIDQLRQARAEVPSPTSQLTSLPGLLSLLAAGGATAAGAPEAGAGVLKGFMAQAGAQQADEQAQLDAQRKETIDLLESNRQRLTTMLTNRPEMFVDSETGDPLVDPRVLMHASTGFMMPINPGINHRLAKQTEHTRQLVALGADLILRGDTPEKRRRGGMLINTALGLNLDDTFFADIATMDETSAWEAIVGNRNLDTISSLAAWKYASENGLRLADPKVISMLAKSAIPEGGELTIDKYTLSLINKFNQAVEQMGPAVQNMSLADQIDAVFGDTNEGDGALLKRYFMGTDAFGTGLKGEQLWAMMQQAGELLKTMYTTKPDSKFLRDRGINSPDDIWSEKGVGDLVSSAVAWAQIANRDAFSQGYGVQIRELAKALAAQQAKQNTTKSLAQLFTEADGIARKFKEEATSATGRLDVDAFNQKVRTYVESSGTATE